MPYSSMFSRRRFVGLLAGLAVAPRITLAHEAGAPLRVAASFSILADWVRNVGGAAVDVTSIVPAGGDAHTFDPAPATVARIADAQVIFAIGAGFEGWLERIVRASGTPAPLIHIADALHLLTGDDEHSHADHDHGDHDPHIWGDVGNAIIAARSIRDALAAADPGNAATFAANANAYTGELRELDAAIRDRVATIPANHRKLVTSHDTFGYYAHAYGFTILGTALGSFSTDAGDPSARDIARLIDDIRASGVPAIFSENVVNPALMQSIADEAGVELAPPLYSDALGEPGSEGDTYIHMMEYNTATIATALGGE